MSLKETKKSNVSAAEEPTENFFGLNTDGWGKLAKKILNHTEATEC